MTQQWTSQDDPDYIRDEMARRHFARPFYDDPPPPLRIADMLLAMRGVVLYVALVIAGMALIALTELVDGWAALIWGAIIASVILVDAARS